MHRAKTPRTCLNLGLLNLSTSFQVDDRTVMGMMWESIPAAEFVDLVSSKAFLGNERIETHTSSVLVNGSRWEVARFKVTTKCVSRITSTRMPS